MDSYLNIYSCKLERHILNTIKEMEMYNGPAKMFKTKKGIYLIRTIDLPVFKDTLLNFKAKRYTKK